MPLADIALVALGSLLVLLTINDVFQSVIVPRSTSRNIRPTFLLWRAAWLAWPRIAGALNPRNDGRREDFLAYFAPLMLIVMLVQWVVLLILGYGTLFWTLRAQIHPPLATFGQACYFAGTSLLTIGFGDFFGQTGIPRYLSLAAAASGLGVVSVTTAYLFSLFGAFQTREAFIVILGARSGAPPTGIGLLAIARYAKAGDTSAIFSQAQHWAASLMETHLAYPTLAYFRSSHDYESWVNTLLTLLDASALLITTIADEPAAEARFFYSLGRHAARDLEGYFNYGKIRVAKTPCMSREAYDCARERLADAGYALQDADDAWRRFSELRMEYAPRLHTLALHFDMAISPWPLDGDFIQAQHLRESFGVDGFTRLQETQKP